MTRRWMGAAAGVAIAVIITGCSVTGVAGVDPAAAAELAGSAASVASASLASTASTAPTTPTTPTTETSSSETSTTLLETTPSTVPSTPGTTTATSTRPALGSLTLGAGTFSIDTLVSALWKTVLVRQGYLVDVKSIDSDTAQLVALKAGSIDVMLGYNGSVAHDFESDLNSTTRDDTDKKLSKVVPAGLAVGTSALADDRATVATSAATAAKAKLATIADLKSVTTLTMADPGGATSKSIVGALKDFYGVTVSKFTPADFGGPKTLAALASGSATFGMVDNCQYQIDRDKLVQLTDPQYMFASQNPIPVYRTGHLSAAAIGALNALDAKLTTADVRSMQTKRFTDNQDLDDVAKDWLQSKGLI